MSYAYDAAGNRTRLSWPDGYSVSYAYDVANRMLSALENGTNALASFDFDQLGRPAWEQYGTGTPAAKVSFSWSNEGDLLTLGHALQGTAGVSYTNGYTPAHQIASATLDNAAYRYVPAASGTDAYVPNALNQYASVTPAGGAAVSIGYDLKGNLASDGAFSFAYDPENKLIAASKTGTAAAYAYDGLGRRDEKTVNGVVTYFLSADADEIAEYDGAGALLRRYVPGPAIDRPIAMVDAAGTKTFFHQDKTGSVIAMSDASGNRTEGPYLYDAFGNGAPYTGVPFKYTGRRLDPETGLYYYRARYYCAPCGRFMQTDSIGYADDINWYTYAGNDPTDRVDPTGEQAQAACVLGGPVAIPCAVVTTVVTAVVLGGAGATLKSDAPRQNAGAANDGKTGKNDSQNTEPNKPQGPESGPPPANQRAREIQGTLSPRTQRSVTTAVTETKEGTRVVTSSEGSLRSAQRGALRPGEVAGKGQPGQHAEVSGVKAAKEMGLTPTRVAPSRPACAACTQQMEEEGIDIIPP